MTPFSTPTNETEKHTQDQCPGCDSPTLKTTTEIETFLYGDDSLEAQVLVFSCMACGLQFTGEAAEKSRMQAVAAFLDEHGKLKETVERLVDRIHKDTTLQSNPMKWREHPSFREIVAFGKYIIPHLIGLLRPGVAVLVVMDALSEIVKDSYGDGDIPVPEEHRGRVDLMLDDWMAWWGSESERQ